MGKEIRTDDVEVRGAEYGPTRIELREDDDGEAKGITGLGIPTGVTADIGWFTEEIDPAAVRHAVTEDWDIRGLFNHDPNMLLGKTGSGTMSIRSAKAGLEYDIPELPETRADVLESVKRRDIDGNSFSFTVGIEEWDEREELDKPHRRIKQFGRLFDVGPVTYPAYEGQTVVSARAMEHVESVSAPLPEPPPEEEPAEPVEASTESAEEPGKSHRERQYEAQMARLNAEE
jgi:HK97 family phage prohead protease